MSFSYLPHRKSGTLAVLVCLLTSQGVVILEAIQQQIFVVLAQQQLWIPSAPYYMSYNDFMKGLPRVIFIGELFFAAILFLWAYEYQKYGKEIRAGAPRAAGPFQAFITTWNAEDTLYATLYGFGGPEWMRNRALGLGDMAKPVTSRTNSDGKSSGEE